MMEYTPESLRLFKENYDKEQKAGVTEQDSGFGFGGFNNSNQTPDTKQVFILKLYCSRICYLEDVANNLVPAQVDKNAR